MKLGVILTLAFVALASLVGLVGYLFDAASDRVLDEVEKLGRSSLGEVEGSNGMILALQASQVAAQELLAERYRSKAEADHDNEWGIAGDIDVDAIEDSLDEFQDQLEVSWEATRSGRRSTDAQATTETEQTLLGLETEFAVYRSQISRLVHLARYHPSDHVHEFVTDVLRPHYRERMLPLIRRYQATARRELAEEVQTIESILSGNNRRNRLLTVAAFSGALLLGLLLARSISRPLTKLREAAVALGAGKLDRPVEVNTRNEIGVLADAFNQMARDLDASTVSRSYLDNILQSMDDLLLVTDAEGRVQTVNRVAQEELAMTAEEVVGRPIAGLFEDGEAGGAFPEAGEQTLVAGERRIPVFCVTSELHDAEGELEGMIYVARNRTDQLQTEHRLRESLAEKEILLKEIHHRVKNNLQIISSLLSLQGGGVEDPEAARRFLESRNRIHSMALLHEQLYRSEDLARIDFTAYAGQLLRRIVQSYGQRGRAVRTHLAVAPTPLDLDQAIPCGMAITELVSNAIEHAFPDGEGEIWVEFQSENGTRRLTVRDNGAGLPPDLDPTTADSLGLKLVSALAEQLDGRFDWRVEDGTEFSIEYGEAAA